MKYYNPNTCEKVKKIAEMADGLNGFRPYLKYEDLCKIWEMAIYYQKVQNDSLKNDASDNIIRSFMAYDERKEKAVYFELRANKNYNRNQFIAFLIGCDYYYMTANDLREYINRVN